MAHYNHGNVESLKAASQVAQYVPVAFLEGGSSVDETVIRAGSVNNFPFGLTIATGASPGDEVAVVTFGRAKAIAAASLGAGVPVAVGSTNGRLIPLLGSGLSTALGSALGAGGIRYQVGVSVQAAADGDIFTVYVDPRFII